MAAAQIVSSVPTTVNLVVYQGDDVYLDLAVTTDGAPADLSGCTVTAQVRASPAADEAVELLATIEGAVVHLHLPHADSAALPLWAVWDCQLVDAAGNVFTIAAGTLKATPEVTR